jgi:hypothetical protein
MHTKICFLADCQLHVCDHRVQMVDNSSTRLTTGSAVSPFHFGAPARNNFAARCNVNLEQPPHGLFLKWGQFQIGAFGVPAICTVLIAIIILFVGRVAGIW